jgi:ribosome-binding factor A
LSIARAYLSVFPSDKGAEIIENVNRSASQIRHELAQKVRYQLRKTPELSFFIDDSLDYIEHIDDLLGK